MGILPVSDTELIHKADTGEPLSGDELERLADLGRCWDCGRALDTAPCSEDCRFYHDVEASADQDSDTSDESTGNPTGQERTNAEWVHEYRRSRGWNLTPLKTNDKAAIFSDWPNRTTPDEQVESVFTPDRNTGLVLGPGSRNTLDVDLDSHEATQAAPYLLPKTNAIFGRKTKPKSHYLYELDSDESFGRVIFDDPDGTIHAEMRYEGHQTMIPRSTHPSGELVEWDTYGNPALTTRDELESRVGRTSAVAMFVRHWSEWEHKHHMIVLALSGGLFRAEWSKDDVMDFVKFICDLAGDTDWEDRRKAVESTFDKYEAGGEYVGFRRLAETIGKEYVDRLFKWLKIPKTTQGSQSKDDFYAFLPQHKYIHRPTGELWDRAGVNAAVGPIPDGDKTVPASVWIDKYNPAHQMTWIPGANEVLEDMVMREGGLQPHPGMRIYNTYRGPDPVPGDPTLAGPWLDHVKRLYPDNWQHIVSWLAHHVQHPADKVNHALVLGGTQGIGKDAMLEAVDHAVGTWNAGVASPTNIEERFNPFLQNVILRISEAHDQGNTDRRKAFYERTKTIIAAPPDTQRIDRKHVGEYRIPNVVGVIFTTNHRTGSLYLPAEDRRHYVAWSDTQPSDFDPGYFDRLFEWYASGGLGHVRAYLETYDLSNFNPKAPPPKTDAFWAMVDAEQSPAESELADLIDRLDTPDAVTLDTLKTHAELHGFMDIANTLADRKNRRQIPILLRTVGYQSIRNPSAKDGVWKNKGLRTTIYARTILPVRDQIAAGQRLASGDTA